MKIVAQVKWMAGMLNDMREPEVLTENNLF